MLTLILASSLRALLLGLAVWAMLKLARLRDAATETWLWAGVLLAALAMPFLTPLEAKGPVLHFSAPHTVQSPPVLGIGLAAPDHVLRAGAWLDSHVLPLVWTLYSAVACWNLLRLVAGLFLSWRLYRGASPIQEAWTGGHDIRVSAAVESPFSVGLSILLPTHYRQWPVETRDAIMAHELSHIRRGDFFLQLLARFYRALFWFNPLSWWLTLRLSELAETASDEAAIRVLRNRAGYAEILMEASMARQPPAPLMAMAKGADIHRRIEHILSDRPLETDLPLAVKFGAAALLLLLTLTFAAARAEVAPQALRRLPELVAARAMQFPPAEGNQAQEVPVTQSTPATQAQTVRAIRPARPATRTVTLAPPAESVTPNPRALLDEPRAVVIPTVIPVMAPGAKPKKAAAGTLSAVSDGSITVLAQPQ